jgi:hypothetical protein
MACFMVEFEIPTPYSPELTARIPLQKMVVDELMEEGKIISYALSENRGRLWMVIAADSDFEVLDIINEFPLINDMHYSISPLMFNHAGSFQVPAFSLN